MHHRAFVLCPAIGSKLYSAKSQFFCLPSGLGGRMMRKARRFKLMVGRQQHFDPRMRWAGRLLAGWVALFTSVALGSAEENSYSVRVWQLDDGLPNHSVTGIVQSQDDYLWVDAWGALARFDGIHFETYDLSQIPDWRNHMVRAVLSSHKGGIWLLLDGDYGHIVYIKPPNAPLFFSNKLPSLRVDSMAEDARGVLWVAFNRGPICRIVNGDVKTVVLSQDLPGSARTILVADAGGTLWAARGELLGMIRNHHFVEFGTHLPSADVNLTAAGSGGLWICSGLNIYQYSASRGLRFVGKLSVDGAGHDRCVPFEDRQGTLWVGTSESGLFRYDGSQFERVLTPQSKIFCLADDRDGDLWVGTSAGLDRVQPQAIELQGASAGLSFGMLNSICQDRDGQMWASTGDGSIVLLQDDHWVARPINLPGAAQIVASDPAGGIWIATRDKNHLLRWNDGKFTTPKGAAGVSNDMISALLVSKAGDLWIGSDAAGRLTRLHNGRATNIQLPSPTWRIRALVQDATGNIWAGSDRDGLVRINVNNQLIDETSRAGQILIRSLFVTPDNSLWIGGDGGLERLKDGHASLITTRQGLYENIVSQIIADDRGWMWIGGDHGIFKVRLQDLNNLADGKIDRIQSFHYGQEQELPRLQARWGWSPCGTRSSDGRLWMPMETALAVVHPDRVAEHLNAPPVYIERVAVDDSPIQPASGLNLLPNYRRLEFDFTALDLSSPENTHFRYLLDGFDDQWTDTIEPRMAVYPRLPPGNYHFRVMASNGDGVWNGQTASVPLVIAPFFWQTWWFEAISLTTFSLSLLILVRYVSFKRLRRRLSDLQARSALERERARIAKDIHDEIGCCLTRIVLLSELSKQQNGVSDRSGKNIHQISSTAREGIKALDETVWAINPRNDTANDMIDYIGQFAVEFLRTANIRCRVDLPEHPPDRSVASEVRHNLFMVVKEAINNVVRHSQATEVWLRVSLTENSVNVNIEDNGQGINGHANGDGDGLRNMRQRVDAIGGQFSLGERAGGGTCISAKVPWTSANQSAN
jgi:signal transduction histidine kinase/ligand-binding sensor domain-containing protein